MYLRFLRDYQCIGASEMEEKIARFCGEEATMEM